MVPDSSGNEIVISSGEEEDQHLLHSPQPHLLSESARTDEEFRAQMKLLTERPL